MGFGYQPICNWEVTGVAPDGRLGISVSSAGDVNDDGYDDVIVGAHFSPTALDDKEGKAFIWLGSPTGLNYSTSPADADCSISGMHPKGHLGRSVSSAGDVNFDGYDDVIVGEPGRNTARGRVNIFFGNGTCVDTTAFWYYDGTWSNAWLGNAVASAGHRNNDDYADVIAGAPLYSNGETEEGAALIFYGSATGPGLSPDETLEGNQENAYYGYSVASAGDIDNDGYTEILIGAPYYNTLDLTNAGAAFLYRGSDSGIISTPFWTGFGQQDDGTFGWSVASAGDVDGQSADDILVGAPYQDDPEVDEGLVYYYTFDRLNVYLPLMVR